MKEFKAAYKEQEAKQSFRKFKGEIKCCCPTCRHKYRCYLDTKEDCFYLISKLVGKENYICRFVFVDMVMSHLGKGKPFTDEAKK